MANKKEGILNFLRSLVKPDFGRPEKKKAGKKVTEYELDDTKNNNTEKYKRAKDTKKYRKKKAIKTKITAKKKTSKTSKAPKKTRPVGKKRISKKLTVSKTAPLHHAPDTHLNLQRYPGNPIIAPNGKNAWESKATFNPAAIYAGGKVHLIYRAIGDNDESVLGYAVSHNGIGIHKRHSKPSFFQKKNQRDVATTFSPKVPYSSGGGWNGGCEDPRLCNIEDKVYLTYTAFDGWGSIRMTLSSISLADFLDKKWNWTEPVHISPPDQIHKNWVLFPEKINGQYAILHSIAPKIQIYFFDDLEKFDGDHFIESYHKNVPRKKVWDNWVRGAGPPPIKTKHGWLLLYHAMDYLDPNRYKLGAMLLDLKNPSTVLYRSKKPILEPDECYENEGFKRGVVYSCGAAVIKNTLFVYYGGADKVCCVAAANLSKFLDELTGEGAPKLKAVTKRK